MKMEEYLEEIKGQIRDKYAKEFVSEEMKNHIEEQAEAYQSEGIPQEEAYSKAVEDMGDPVSVGADLDKIHRPHMEWKFLGYVLFISLLSIGVHYLINREMTGQQTLLESIKAGLTGTHIRNILMGIAAMLLVYRADYTVLLGKSRLIGGIYLGLITVAAIFFGNEINGTRGWICIGSVILLVHALLILYLPVFAGILYELRGKKKGVIARFAFWMLAPVIAEFFGGFLSIPISLFLIIAEFMLVILAVRKDWYSVDKKRIRCGFAGGLFAAAMIMIVIIHDMAPYQTARLESWLARFGIGHHVTDANGADYVNVRLNEVFSQSSLLGRNDKAAEIMIALPEAQEDLILATITAYCGKLPAAGIAACLGILAIYILYISMRQKNRLGYIVGCACGITIALQSVSNLLIVFGLLPRTGTILPIFSGGASACIVDYMLLGMTLSIYRYKDIRREKNAGIKDVAMS